ncbi:hypothetical protein AB840_03530 [Megasphaera cerevisiae DSM 20462]|uniref:Major facilitator superfamily (MFS) profile domain-containing protein n=1 Tax=Megasphaera cerevisiae DSM 20462 TaxID=1122219 RepID=A0A0J6WUR7_9FIRM|nr:MFS transporter [Megasphaera cerevisiae]KMO87290.1 hypothetical protein AB840_03530 [Megasphaera cerevisiae DSM 20462]SJZ48700.1 MFS transporter, OPA family, sugar phosphate sensor protein UhpC [Megasphaera cerevisiae DSM 20462]
MKNNRYGYTERQYTVFQKYAWKVLLGFSILYCFLYCGRLNLSSALPLMAAEEGWNTTQLGILSSVFFWTYGIGHLINGRLGEIIGINRFIISAVILSAAANLLIGFQSSLLVIALLWGLNGYFQSMAWAPGMSLLSKWWPSNRRGFAAGFANGFAGFGQAVCMGVVIIIFAVIPQAGWRAAFFYPALIAVILSVLYAYGIKETPHAAGLPEYTDNVTSTASELKINASLRGKSKLYPYIYLIKEWKFDVWLLIIALSSIARYGLLNWIPLYFTNTMGMDIKDGLMENLLLSVGMGCGTLVIPALSDKLCRNDRLPAVLTCSVAGGLAVLLFMFSQTMWIIDILLFTAGFFLYAINGLVWPFAIDIGGRQLAGTASGILDFTAYLGAAIQAIVFGLFLGSGSWSMLFAAITIVCAAMAVLSVAAAGNTKDAAPAGIDQGQKASTII